MRPCLAMLACLALPAFADTPVTRVEVFASHESGAVGREERLTAVQGKGGLELRLKVTLGCEVEELDPVQIPREEWTALLELVDAYGLQSWNFLPRVAPDWGAQGYEILAKEAVSRRWTGPFDGWAPPMALHRRMAELAHALYPRIPLEFFKADRGPAKCRLRAWTNAGGLVHPPKHGGPMHDVEIEAWDDRKRMTVRSYDQGLMRESVIVLTAEKWDRLWAAATAPAIAAWDGKEGLFQTVDHAGGGLAVNGPDVRIRHAWNAPDLPSDEGPVGTFLKALGEAATPDPRGVELVGQKGVVSALIIDFAVVTPQTKHFPCKMGSATLEFRDMGDGKVELTVGGEIEMGKKPPVVYRVPRTEGLKKFENTATGPDLSSLEAFRQK